MNRRDYVVGDRFSYDEGDGWILTKNGWVYCFKSGGVATKCHNPTEWIPPLESMEVSGEVIFNRKLGILYTIKRQWVNVNTK